MLLLAASVRRLLPEPVRGRAGPIRHAHSQEAPPATHGLLQCIGSLESRRGRRLAIPRHTSPRLAPYRLTREQAWAAATVPRARRRGPGECAPANPTAGCLSESCSGFIHQESDRFLDGLEGGDGGSDDQEPQLL